MTILTQSFLNAADADGPLDVVPVAGRIGAEIRGVALGGDLDDAERALRAAEELLSEAEDVDDEDRLEHVKEMQDLRAQLASAREGDDVV